MSFKYLQTCECNQCLVKDNYLIVENIKEVFIQTGCGCILNEKFESIEEAELFINAFTARRKYALEENNFLDED